MLTFAPSYMDNVEAQAQIDSILNALKAKGYKTQVRTDGSRSWSVWKALGKTSQSYTIIRYNPLGNPWFKVDGYVLREVASVVNQYTKA